MLRLFTFGSVNLEGPPEGDPGAVLAQSKRLALLVYLAAARPFGVHRRDELLALFWPDLDDTRARDALNQALRFLRQALGPDVFVRRGGEDVGIDPGRLWCDAAAFRVALDGGRPAEALELYRGDFLQGFFIEESGGFEEWMERERAAHREAAARGAREVAEREAEGGGYTQAIAWGRRALELAPDDERALRRLLRWYDRAGDRAGALRTYQSFASRFEDEFGCEPSPETAALAAQLRAGTPLGRDPVLGTRNTAPPGPPPSATVSGGFGDRYRIERELGSGGMARVYLGHDLKHDREVAIKVLRAEVVEGLARERFIREIRIAGRLQHPNIVPLFDSGEVDGQLFYVMPHVQGETLRDRLAREGSLPVDETVHILRELATALAYAHDQGVTHRDIKPANILLIDRRAVLADFGIARAAQAAQTPTGHAEASLTQVGVSLGTPAYMAPEQAAGSPEIDHRTDLYALGIVGYEMLVGRPPFARHSPEQLLAAQLTEAPIALAALRPDTPFWLDALLMQCLEKTPSARPGSASIIAEALEQRRGGSRRRMLGGRLLRWSGVIVLMVAGVLALTKIVGPREQQRAGASPVLEEATQVAVRPFVDRSPDRALGYIAEDLTVDVISELARIPVLRVRSASAIAPLQRETPDSIRQVLGVGTLIEGSVLGDHDSLRLSVTIIRAHTGDELTHRRWVVPRDRLLGSKDSVVAEVGRFIRDWIGNDIRSRQSRLATRDMQAWEHFQIGTLTFQEAKRLYRAGETVAAAKLLRVADSLLGQAERGDRQWIDPALARGWLAYWRGLKGTELYGDTARQRNLEAIELAERVLARSANHPEALELRGTSYLRMVIDGVSDSSTLTKAGDDLRRASVPANPFQARAWHSLSMAHRLRGQVAEANVAARRAYELDPFMEFAEDLLSELCSTSFELRQVTDAETSCSEGRRRFPDRLEFPYYLLQLLPLPNRARPSIDSAWALFRDLERATPPAERGENRPGWVMMVASAVARAGQPDSARSLLAAARREATNASDLDVYDAAALTTLGDYAAALDRLRAYLTKHPLNGAMVAVHPSFAPLAADLRFKQLTGARTVR